MFKKPKRNFRDNRRDDGDSDDDHAGRSEDAKKKDSVSSKTDTAKRLNEKSKTSAVSVKGPSTILSFDGEEEGEVFQIKKSKTSQRVARQLKKDNRKEKKALSDEEEEYQNNQSVKASNGQNEREKQRRDGGGTEKRKEFKKIKSESESSNSDNDDNDDDDDEAGGSAANSVQQFLQSGQIPDAHLIHMARKKRQQARAMGDDYVPIDDTVKYEKPSSRLIRDDDNDRSDDSDGEVLTLTSKQKDAERKKLQEQILMAEEDSGSGGGSDKEGDWEEMQLRKGFCLPAAHQQMQQESMGADVGLGYYGGYPMGYPVDTSYYSTGMDAGGGGGLSMPPPPPPPIAIAGGQMIGIDDIKSRLTSRLEEMSTRHRVHTVERDDLRRRGDLSLSSILTLKQETTHLENQYQFFQETRGFVRDFIECMNEKMTSVLYLERCMNELYQKRSEKLTKRRQDDVRDQSMEYTAGKASVVSSDPDEVNRSRRRADREARRTRRKRGRERQNVTEHNDGWSTDDEDTSLSDATKFKNEKESGNTIKTFRTFKRIMGDCATVFDDVVEEFCQYGSIKKRFEQWKKEFGDTYSEAYIGMCLPKLFSPLIKLELITWNPLEAGSKQFEECGWYESLMFYSYSSDVATSNGEEKNGTEEQKEDSDDMLVPSIVEKMLLPRLTTLVEQIWDPMSLQQTKRLSDNIRRLVEDYPSVNSDSKNTQILIKAVFTRLNKSVNDDVFIPLYAKSLLENRHSDTAIYFHRQTWAAIKLMTSAILWEGIISTNQLKSIVFDCLLNRYLLIALTNCPIGTELINKCHAITNVLPRDWFLACTSEQTLPQLENFCRFLLATAKQTKSNVTQNIDSREILRQIRKILVHIHATNHAMALSDF